MALMEQRVKELQRQRKELRIEVRLRTSWAVWPLSRAALQVGLRGLSSSGIPLLDLQPSPGESKSPYSQAPHLDPGV